MPPRRIIDSHIHLWPHSAASPSGHSWMEPGALLTRQFSIGDYIAANKHDPALEGFVYVETDRKLNPFRSEDQNFEWASETFEEVKWLKRIVEGTPLEGEGFTKEQGDLMKGAVIWAPVDHGLDVFKRYIQMARDVAGDKTWKRVKGIRFLLQGIHDETKFKQLVLSAGFADVLRYLPQTEERLSFDVGVDATRAGVWQLEVATDAIESLRAAGESGKNTVFILSEFCEKPFRNTSLTESDHMWASCIERLSKDPNVYMKLSGGFSEMQKQEASNPWPSSKVADTMRPWLDRLFKCFSPDKVMFGSDWPVCNVGGPGIEHAWSSWKVAVNKILENYHLTDEQQAQIWHGTALEAYRL
ncbi:hypothetical protein NA57DRAFT_35937 [Rhizodiscina lignyota]|uniref:Amidohydrolase-related domain-containing protein n=1 Tax=Rhizodiscina lignyota TaxID=1504668 RepID=A0A9P4IG06_9PEZI|nr:hypothetical protein NA57DRAFT_35937 [Rhizodiscina lignyota]